VAEVKLNAVKREATGKGSARRSRESGNVPGVVYGHGMEPLSIEVNRREFVTALQRDSGLNTLLELQIDGSRTLALTKELQRDPVRGTLLHADFIQVSRDEEVEVEVPLHLVGTAPGVGEGGVLEHPLATLQVRAKATAVPEFVEADVSGLGVGDSLRVSDLSEDRTFHITNDPDTVVASITAPVSEAELESLEAGVGIGAEQTSDDAAAPTAPAGDTADDV